MIKNKILRHGTLFFLVVTIGILSLGAMEGDKKGGSLNNKTYRLSKTQQSGKVGDAYRMNINNLNIPINRIGTIAAVNIPPDGTLGRFGNSHFLFSAGFMMSGYTNGSLWAFAQATASLIENMTPGTVASGQNDPDAQMYVVRRIDPPYDPETGAVHKSWLDWKVAVDKFGADFYDGDGDGEYNPLDKNGNKIWDTDEDAPDLLGDETAWCVYTDGVPGAQRLRFAGVNPQGVEIRQTVFAFASKGALGNIMFIRYRISNSGLVANQLDSVYFGVWADPDVGAEFEDDLVGVDVSRNAGFTYNGDGLDAGGYGTQVPCFMIDFFSGPAAFIPGVTFTDNNGDGIYTEGVDTPLDTAYSNRGQLLGVRKIPGAKNLDISSFVHYQQSDPERGDPDDEFEARYFMLGLLPTGDTLYACNDNPLIGTVKNALCDTIDPRFWYSGDPVTQRGWLNIKLTDQRQMTNVGPFSLRVGEEKEITVAYVVGQGTNPINSITVARAIDDGAQFIFDGNFRAPNPPPAITPVVESGPDFIDFIFPTYEQVSFKDSTDAWDNRFQGINVYAYKTNSTQETISGTENEKVYLTYMANNFIKNVYKENPETGGRELLYPEAQIKLNTQVYSDPSRGKIRIRVTNDPFTGGKLIKGKPYYFAFSSYAINYSALFPMDASASFGTPGNYYLSSSGFVSEVENVPRIVQVVLGEDIYSPPVPIGDGLRVAGGSRGKLQFDVVSKSDLTGDKYKVTLYPDSSAPKYESFWKIENVTKGKVLRDSAKSYLYGNSDISDIVTEGFIVKLSSEVANIDSLLRSQTSQNWLGTGSAFHYVSTDIDRTSKIKNIGGNLHTYNGNVVRADRLRRIEIRFGVSQKAYRYLNGFIGTTAAQRQRFFRYAENVTSANSQNDAVLLNGKWDTANNRAIGYVDVPFQVWVDDPNFGESRQLAVGFIEKSTALGGKPDGNWDPGTSLAISGEYIFIFDAPYDPNGNQNIYKGGPYIGGTNPTYADLNGAAIQNGAFYTIPNDANISAVERTIGRSSFFNTLFAVGLERKDTINFYSEGDKVILNVLGYPYTSADVFEFQTKKEGVLSDDQEKALFNSVNVFPNPMYGFNVATSYTNSPADEPFVTFSNLPEEVTIKIYSLSGQLLRSLGTSDKSAPSSPFLRWDLQNESGLRVASGMYLAIVSSPKYGEKVLKFAIVMPQKQIQKY